MLAGCRLGETSGQIMLSGLRRPTSANDERPAPFSRTPRLVADRVDRLTTSAGYCVGRQEQTFHCELHPRGIRPAMTFIQNSCTGNYLAGTPVNSITRLTVQLMTDVNSARD